MKKIIDIQVEKKEEDSSRIKRREEYALKRDLLASENNSAISKRSLPEEKREVNHDVEPSEKESTEESKESPEVK